MKLKTIKTFALAALMVAGFSSCEDMLRVDSKTVMFDYQNTLDDPTDTVYSVLGIVNKLQKIADRTVILGEIRGDLVKVSDHATQDLRDLYEYDFSALKSTNKYDKPVDFYAVINNCNFFLAHVDTSLVRQQRNVMKGEYITVLCYRAWAYLQLAQIYGEVPYKPIESDPAANGEKVNIKDLAKLLLLDFKDEYITFYDRYQPNYGNIGGGTLGDGTSASSHATKDMFIPIRLILGDLCLWAEDYAHAALYYHDFLAGDNRAYTTGTDAVTWLTWDFLYTGYDEYSYETFGGSNAGLAFIPMEADQYSGTVSELPEIYNSIAKNDYWYQLTRSRAATAISVRQNYCYHAKLNAQNRYTWPAYMANKNDAPELLLRGDLRQYAVLETTYDDYYAENDRNSSKYGTEIQTLNKINSEKIWLYRKDVVYLRLAEALNRCNLPQTAFAILKEGLCKETIDSLSRAEKDRATNIDGVDITAVYDFPTSRFQKAQIGWYNDYVYSGGSEVTVYCAEWQSGNTMGLHSRGCGDASYDTLYTIGKKLEKMAAAGQLTGNEQLDSVRAVEEYLIDEMALETCYEGYRFGDLMRIAMHRGKDVGGAFENEFLAKRVATRETASLDDNVDYYQTMDNALYTKLLGDGKSLNKAWFLILPDEK